LQAGTLYTRLPASQYASQWQRATQIPTHEDWRQLLAQEARAVAGGQGANRLEIVVGDSFGLWLPSESLPHDRLWLNQSISGEATYHILQRLSAFADTRPSTIHLLAGANDLKHDVPEAQIVHNLHLMVQQLQRQHPQARIVVYSVFPTRRVDISSDRVRALNTRIAAMTQQNGVEYRNVAPFMEDDGGDLRRDLTTDGLHLNDQGYDVWQQAIVASL
jgi:lysophospholipase L1-like esterase